MARKSPDPELLTLISEVGWGGLVGTAVLVDMIGGATSVAASFQPELQPEVCITEDYFRTI